MSWEAQTLNKNNLNIQKYFIFAILILLFIIFSILAPSFLTINNLMNLLIQSTVFGVVGFGLAIIMISGEIDLSYSGVIPLQGAIFATFLINGKSLLTSMLLTLSIGLFVSFCISLLITKLKLNSFVTTVAMMFLLQGIWQMFTGGKNIYLGDSFQREWVYGTIGQVPIVVIFFIVIFIVLFIITEQTPFGIRMRIVGEDVESAKTSGLNPNIYKIAAFLIGGCLFFLGSFLSTVRLSGAMATSGVNLMMPVMTVAFIGQTVLGMNRPNIPGVLLASLLLGMVNNAFVLLRLPFWSVPMVLGIILLLSIYLTNIGKKDIVQIGF